MASSGGRSTVCPTVLKHGSCTVPNCNFVHTVPNCITCNITSFTTLDAYKRHMKGPRHRDALAGHSGKFGFAHCIICRLTVRDIWSRHLETSTHRSEAAKRKLNWDVEPQEVNSVPGHQYCGTCDQHIREAAWPSHSSTTVHRHKLQSSSYNSLLDGLTSDKHGVVVTGAFDFGIVEPQAASAGKQAQCTITLTSPVANVALVQARLASSQGRLMQTLFELSCPPVSRLYHQRPSPFTVTMKSSHVGRNEDRLELTFRDQQLGVNFVIVRALQVIVGSKADHDLLRPTAPYVPRRKTTRLAEVNIVEGIPAPALRAIPYKDKLPLAPIPSALGNILSNVGSVTKAVGRLRVSHIPAVFNVETYGRHFKTLIWAEEARMETDLERYDMENATLQGHNAFYYLKVPGLAEKRPSVLVGDSILVQPPGAKEGHWFDGRVHVVRKEEVGLRLHGSFRPIPGQKFYIRFKLNRYPLRRQHLALDTVFTQERVLFPTEANLGNLRSPSVRIQPYNRLLATNPPQLLAVAAIIHRPAGSIPFVVFGPPGTGKTVTIVESMLQLLRTDPQARILACAPSNSAADLIAIKLHDAGLTKDELFRAYAPSRHKDQTPTALLDHSYLNQDGHYSVPPIPVVKRFRVIVITCVAASMISGIGIPRGHYSHIFVDEAGQATEPEAMISIKTMADNATNIILSGDPKQLGPIIRSAVARELGLETSYIERLMKREIYDEERGYGRSVVKLIQNFRSHPAILKFPNERFYGGDLRARGDPKVINAYLSSTHVARRDFPIVFYAVSGKDDREASSPSFFNSDEASKVKSLVMDLRSDRRIGLSDQDIGIIAPYHAQCLKIRKILSGHADGVKVGSVEEFQGQERRVVIISTVRSSQEFIEYDLRHTLGFVASPRRFNVAVTRAQALLLIVGDPNVLSLDPLWRSFLNYCHNNGGWRGPSPCWDTTETVKEEGGYDAAIRETALQDMNEFTRAMEEMTLGAAAGEDDGVDRPWRDVE